jgi:hypothetical protein
LIPPLKNIQDIPFVDLSSTNPIKLLTEMQKSEEASTE